MQPPRGVLGIRSWRRGPRAEIETVMADPRRCVRRRRNPCLELRSRLRRGERSHNQGWLARIPCVELESVLPRRVDLGKEVFPVKLQVLQLRKVNDRARCDKRLAWIVPLMFCIGLTAASKANDDTSFLADEAVPQAALPVPVAEVASPEVLAIARDISKRFHLPTEMAQEITREAYRAADLNDVRPVEATLVLAVIAVESSYRPTVINRHTGATGLMQVNAKWHQDKVHDVGGEQMLLAVAPNIWVGTAILAEYLGRERGRIDPALGRYWGSAQADQYVQRVRDQMRHLSNVAKRATTLSASTLITSG